MSPVLPTILVVDDERDIVDLISLNLARNGFATLTAGDGVEALVQAMQHLPDLIILDLMMPKKDGLAVFRELRADARTQHIPVVMLTARGTINDRIAGLELGADDYVGKPFSPKELVLRVKSLLKRSRRVTVDATTVAGAFRLDRNSLKLFLAGAPVDLTATEFKLIRILIDGAGEPVDRETLLSEAWGYADSTLSRTLDTHVRRLREKLGRHADCVQTVRGVGYKFVVDAVP